MPMEHVILVDEYDREIGQMEKLQAHESGNLHRALSVFLFNSKGELLLQQRALEKYHSPGLWTNTCCSHPRPGEQSKDAAVRRLKEEMGMSCTLTKSFDFIYRAEFENGLIEHELDHVFIGCSDDKPVMNPSEVASWKYISQENLVADIRNNPDLYTVWFKLCLQRVLDNYFN
ncbi:MAG: isopentenyl-diphosphate Delta-isomerase [Cryomorphaceae bacterium]|nr:isopentenyl-diphosphate Delta-isomerase [Cryomorphaceae bacterium]